MKAVRFHGARDIRVEDVAEPTARLGAHDVLIKPITTGICGTDLHEYIAGPIVTPSTPHVYTGATNPQILGHEFSAVVADTGSAVTNVKAGDRVSIQPLISPRDDYFGRRGLYHLSPQMACVGLSWAWGGMGELAIVNDYTRECLALVVDTLLSGHRVGRGGFHRRPSQPTYLKPGLLFGVVDEMDIEEAKERVLLADFEAYGQEPPRPRLVASENEGRRWQRTQVRRPSSTRRLPAIS